MIVTGAASGIGRATASRIAREGGRVIAVDISAEKLDELTAELAGCRHRHRRRRHHEAGRRSTRSSPPRATGSTRLANVAGINDDFSPAARDDGRRSGTASSASTSPAPFKLSRAVLPVMQAAGTRLDRQRRVRGGPARQRVGQRLHGLEARRHRPHPKSAAFMYGPQGIRVNAVAPGGVATGIPFPPNVSEVGSGAAAPVPAAIPTVATAEQLAASITFLLSDDGVNINGAVLASDGGWSVQ